MNDQKPFSIGSLWTGSLLGTAAFGAVVATKKSNGRGLAIALGIAILLHLALVIPFVLSFLKRAPKVEEPEVTWIELEDPPEIYPTEFTHEESPSEPPETPNPSPPKVTKKSTSPLFELPRPALDENGEEPWWNRENPPPSLSIDDLPGNSKDIPTITSPEQQVSRLFPEIKVSGHFDAPDKTGWSGGQHLRASFDGEFFILDFHGCIEEPDDPDTCVRDWPLFSLNLHNLTENRRANKSADREGWARIKVKATKGNTLSFWGRDAVTSGYSNNKIVFHIDDAGKIRMLGNFPMFPPVKRHPAVDAFMSVAYVFGIDEMIMRMALAAEGQSRTGR